MDKEALIGAGRTADAYAWENDLVLKLYQDWMPAVTLEQEFTVTGVDLSAGMLAYACKQALFPKSLYVLHDGFFFTTGVKSRQTC